MLTTLGKKLPPNLVFDLGGEVHYLFPQSGDSSEVVIAVTDKNYRLLDENDWVYDEENNEIGIYTGEVTSTEEKYIVEYRPESPDYDSYEWLDQKQYIYDINQDQLIISHLLEFEADKKYIVIPPKTVDVDLNNMYDVKPGTPVSELSSDFNLEDSELQVENGEKLLPEPPNMITIYHQFDRQNFETILYHIKDGDTLSGLIRGVQGSMRRWPEGTTVSRLITAKDINDMQENVEELNRKLTLAAEGLFSNIDLEGGRADSRYIPREKINGGDAMISD